MSKLHYRVLYSGSTGNCVIIENMMFDCGVPFKAIKSSLYYIDYLIITHTHSDHLKESTLNQIRKYFPNIKVIGNYEVAQTVPVDVIANSEYVVKGMESYNLIPFECEHDVLTYGYTFDIKGKRVIYATDTNNLDAISKDDKFDYLFIESNHDEEKIKLAKSTKGYDPKISAIRHLSTQKSKAFYYLHRKSKDSEWIELHKSKRFY